jgi:thiol-disulfide isomerase/thioredoxin
LSNSVRAPHRPARREWRRAHRDCTPFADAPWCGHCKRLAPVLEDIAERPEATGAFKIGKVDCTTEKNVCSKYGVNGFPTLKVFYSGKVWEYRGARTNVAIEALLARMQRPAVRDVTTVEELNELLAANANNGTATFFLGDGGAGEGDGLRSSFVSVADSLMHKDSFARASDPVVLKALLEQGSTEASKVEAALGALPFMARLETGEAPRLLDAPAVLAKKKTQAIAKEDVTSFIEADRLPILSLASWTNFFVLAGDENRPLVLLMQDAATLGSKEARSACAHSSHLDRLASSSSRLLSSHPIPSRPIPSRPVPSQPKFNPSHNPPHSIPCLPTSSHLVPPPTHNAWQVSLADCDTPGAAADFRELARDDGWRRHFVFAMLDFANNEEHINSTYFLYRESMPRLVVLRKSSSGRAFAVDTPGDAADGPGQRAFLDSVLTGQASFEYEGKWGMPARWWRVAKAYVPQLAALDFLPSYSLAGSLVALLVIAICWLVCFAPLPDPDFDAYGRAKELPDKKHR